MHCEAGPCEKPLSLRQLVVCSLQSPISFPKSCKMMMVMTRNILRHGIFPLILVTSMVVTRAEQKINESSGITGAF